MTCVPREAPGRDRISNGPREYLERYELDTLSMVGTFSNEESYWALVRDPEGVIHRVPVGNYIGKNHGKVVRYK